MYIFYKSKPVIKAQVGHELLIPRPHPDTVSDTLANPVFGPRPGPKKVYRPHNVAPLNTPEEDFYDDDITSDIIRNIDNGMGIATTNTLDNITIDLSGGTMDYVRNGERLRNSNNFDYILGGNFINGDGSENLFRAGSEALQNAITNMSSNSVTNNPERLVTGVEDGSIKIGTADEFKPDTMVYIAPAAGKYASAKMRDVEFSKDFFKADHLRIVGLDGKPMYQPHENDKGKFILFDRSTGAKSFVAGTTRYLIEALNKFKQTNPNAAYMTMDAGAFARYNRGEEGLNSINFTDYYDQDIHYGPGQGYNFVYSKNRLH